MSPNTQSRYQQAMRPPASIIARKQVNYAQLQYSTCPHADLLFIALDMPTTMLTSALPCMLMRYGAGIVAVLVQRFSACAFRHNCLCCQY